MTQMSSRTPFKCNFALPTQQMLANPPRFWFASSAENNVLYVLYKHGHYCISMNIYENPYVFLQSAENNVFYVLYNHGCYCISMNIYENPYVFLGNEEFFFGFSSTNLPGGNLVDGLPPAPSLDPLDKL